MDMCRYPLKVSDYAVANKIIEEPAFYWWAKADLKRRNRIVKYRYWSRTHKFGLKLPHIWEEAIANERKMGTNYWRHTIEKLMEAEGIAFNIFNDRQVGHNEIN